MGIGSALDSMISVVFPRWGASRASWRMSLQRTQAAASDHQMMRQMLGSREGGYEAGKKNRLTINKPGSAHENDIPRQQIANMRVRSWNLYRNNPQARKICRTLGAKVIGCGLEPQSQATTKDGNPFVEFRKRARLIWLDFIKESDFRGKPGRGGHTFTTQAKTALRSVVLSGGVLARFRHLDRKEQKRLDLLLPLQVQLLHVDRIDETKNGDGQFYGCDLDSDGKITAFHIIQGGQKSSKSESIPVPAKEIVHLFAEEDIDQLLGSPWLGAALLTMDDRRGYETSEILAAEAGACFVAGYRRSNGQSTGIGLPDPESNYELTDGTGNRVERLQPMMFVDLGKTGEFDMINPNRPNSGAESFLNHLVRSEAVAAPGVKASTLTGDYRNSSFSSERTADNDAWPEIEELQAWFGAGFYQPIYEEVITTAVTSGLFDKIAGFSAADFNDRKREYLKTNWQGPVARSINPVDDAEAAGTRVQKMQSSPQRECAKVAADWREIIHEFDEFIQACKDAKLPDDFWQQALGIEQKDQPQAGAKTRASESQQDAAAALRRAAMAQFSVSNHA